KIIEFVRSQQSGGPIDIAANLDAGREIAIGERIRQQSNDLPAPSSPTVADLSKMRVEIERPDPAPPKAVDVPQAKVDPTPRKVMAPAAPPAKPLEKAEALAMT